MDADPLYVVSDDLTAMRVCLAMMAAAGLAIAYGLWRRPPPLRVGLAAAAVTMAGWAVHWLSASELHRMRYEVPVSLARYLRTSELCLALAGVAAILVVLPGWSYLERLKGAR